MNDAALATMAKIRLLYGADDDRFLAFNPVGIPMTAADLSFVDSTGETAPSPGTASPQARLSAAADFATLANLVPSVDDVWMHDGRLLWNEYGAVFRLAEVASDELSDAERDELDAAYDLLYEKREVTDPETGETHTDLVETETYEAYRRYQRAYGEARERHEEAKLTAEHASDPAVREDAEAKRDRLEAEVEEALRDWRVKGHRNEVEEALADVDRLTGRGPQLLWRDWTDQYRRGGPETDVVIDRPFYRTTVWPTSFLDDAEAWTEVTLDGSEVDSLVEQARETMPAFVDSGLLDDPGQAELDVFHVSVELARVELVRPWFDPGVLRSRAWRWSHGREPLSDGDDPPHGSLPAYPTSMVFARNLRVDVEPPGDSPEAGGPERTVARLAAQLPVTFGPMLLEQVPSTVEPGTVDRLETATFDPEETAALREVARETAVARTVPARAARPATVTATVERPDLVERSPALADAATVIAGANLRGRPTAGSLDAVGAAERLPLRAALELRTRTGTLAGDVVARDAAARDAVTSARPRTAVSATRVRDHRAESGAGTTVVRDHRTDPPTIRVDPGDVVRPTPPDRETGLEGQVRERLDDGSPGDPIEGVRITFEQDGSAVRRTVQTDDEGRYRVTLPRGQFGRYLVSARRYGYVDHPSSGAPMAGLLSLPADGSQEYSFTMARDPAEQPRRESWKTMQLVAFVCAKVPKSPNPDPDLTWSG